MKKIYYILSALFLCVVATSAQEAGKTVVIKTNVGTMKAILYDDVPNHTRTFIERAKRGDFNGTLFTRVLPEFMIQGGAPDSKNAPAGAKCGFGDPCYFSSRYRRHFGVRPSKERRVNGTSSQK